MPSRWELPSLPLIILLIHLYLIGLMNLFQLNCLKGKENMNVNQPAKCLDTMTHEEILVLKSTERVGSCGL